MEEIEDSEPRITDIGTPCRGNTGKWGRTITYEVNGMPVVDWENLPEPGETNVSCYCLCAANHPEHVGICTGSSTGALRFSQFPDDSPLSELGSVDVQMCEPCRQKTLDAKGS